MPAVRDLSECQYAIAQVDEGRTLSKIELKHDGKRTILWVDPFSDSPGDHTDPGVTTFKVTAVAVCRSGCGDRLLSTYFFTFDNANRTVPPVVDDKTDHNDRSQYDEGMKDWSAKGGTTK